MTYSRLIGLTGVVLAVLALPAAALDSVLGAFLMLGALVLGGLSCLGWRSEVRYAATSLLVTLVAALSLARYSAPSGLPVVHGSPPLQWALLCAATLAPVSLLLVLHHLRRRHRTPRRMRRVSVRARTRRS